VLVLDMIEILPPLEKYKYDTWRILSVKCYIDNSMRLRSCIRNVNMSPELSEPKPMEVDARAPLGGFRLSGDQCTTLVKSSMM
jgi:hypothetical protein